MVYSLDFRIGMLVINMAFYANSFASNLIDIPYNSLKNSLL